MSDTPIYDNVGDDVPLFKQNETAALNEANRVQTVIKTVDNTPNVRIENSDSRRTITKIVTALAAILGTVIVVDISSPAFDLRAWTDPITAGFLYVTGVYGIVVTLPNIPKRQG